MTLDRTRLSSVTMRVVLAVAASLSALLLPLLAAPVLPIPPQVDVLVVGGTPPGIAAGIAAARLGMRTLLVEQKPEIGGDITNAWLNTFDLNRAPNGMQLSRGIFLEAYQKLGQTFDLGDARRVLVQMVRAEPRLGVLTGVRVTAPHIEEGRVVGAHLIAPTSGARYVAARVVIDATDTASFAVSAGVGFTVGREDVDGDSRTQAVTLIFKLGGVNRDRVVQYLRKHEEPFDLGGVRERYMWGYGRILKRFRARDPQIGAYDLNLSWQSDGTVLVNALQVFGVDGTDPRAQQRGRNRAMAELPHFIAFLRRKAPGLERARLLGAAPYLYVRETRHIRGLYRVTGEDVMQGRDFSDRVAVASYPIDLHPYAPGATRNLLAPQRKIYAIPFRALVPLRRVDNLLVVGKGVSATRAASGSLRIIPTGMTLGEAAGHAAAMSARLGVTPRQIALHRPLIQRLQASLGLGGAFLPSPHLIRRALRAGWPGLAEEAPGRRRP